MGASLTGDPRGRPSRPPQRHLPGFGAFGAGKTAAGSQLLAGRRRTA